MYLSTYSEVGFADANKIVWRRNSEEKRTRYRFNEDSIMTLGTRMVCIIVPQFFQTLHN